MELEQYSLSVIGKQTGEHCLHFEVACSPSPEGDVAYAFYLFHDQDRVSTRWYTADAWADFQVSERGIYTASAFLKCGDAVRITKSKPILFIPPVRFRPPAAEAPCRKSFPISIFGSCVSRDMLEFAPRPLLELKTYVARQTVQSAVSPPLPCRQEDIRLASKFQQRMVYYDLAKMAFELFHNDGSQYLLLDLVDERFPTAAYHGSAITLSEPLVRSGFLDGSQLPITLTESEGQYHTECGRGLEEDIDSFCSLLLSCYPPKHIFLHRVRHTNYYWDAGKCRVEQFSKNAASFNNRLNRRTEWMYEQLKSRLPGCETIDLCAGYCADPGHKWGLAPVHFEAEYYQKVFERIEEILIR